MGFRYGIWNTIRVIFCENTFFHSKGFSTCLQNHISKHLNIIITGYLEI